MSSIKLVFVPMEGKFPFGFYDLDENNKNHDSNKRLLVSRKIHVNQNTRQKVIKKLESLKEIASLSKFLVKVESIMDENTGLHVIY